MKYKVRYLMEMNFVYMNNIYDFNDYEINNNEEIELNIIDYTNIDFVNNHFYCKIKKNNKYYMGTSCDDLEKLKRNAIYNKWVEDNKFKLVKDIIIEDIIE